MLWVNCTTKSGQILSVKQDKKQNKMIATGIKNHAIKKKDLTRSRSNQTIIISRNGLHFIIRMQAIYILLFSFSDNKKLKYINHQVHLT